MRLETAFVLTRPSDASDRSDIAATSLSLGGLLIAPCSGFLHLANAHGCFLVTAVRPFDLLEGSNAKAQGGRSLLTVMQCYCLSAALLFSSISFLANHSVTCRGTTVYSTANNYITALACNTRRGSGLTATCIQMGNVGEQGSGALVPSQCIASGGWVRITLREYSTILARSLCALSQPHSLCVLPRDNDEALREFDGPSVRKMEEMKHMPSASDAVSARAAALWRTLFPEKRLAASAKAVRELERALTPRQPPPQRCQVTVVGVGLTGLAVGSFFAHEGASCALLEKTGAVGGVWRWYGNPFSRVNSTEPGYRMPIKHRSPNSNHSHFCEILTDCLLVIEQYDLSSRIHLEMDVTGTSRLSLQQWRTTGVTPSGRFAIASSWTVICTNRRLGTPRELPISNEVGFVGEVRRGVGCDADALRWQGKQIVMLGHGPYALENMRTGLEHGAGMVVFLCRRHGVVCPEAVDYVNYIRPYNDHFQHPQGGGATVVNAWRKAYRMSSATPPEVWKQGQILPDGHTVSISDICFVAHYL